MVHALVPFEISRRWFHAIVRSGYEIKNKALWTNIRLRHSPIDSSPPLHPSVPSNRFLFFYTSLPNCSFTSSSSSFPPYLPHLSVSLPNFITFVFFVFIFPLYINSFIILSSYCLLLISSSSYVFVLFYSVPYFSQSTCSFKNINSVILLSVFLFLFIHFYVFSSSYSFLYLPIFFTLLFLSSYLHIFFY